MILTARRRTRNGIGSRVRIMCLSGLRFRVEDPIQTLSALARPGKALALEAQIELWSATKICRRALFSFLDNAVP